MQYDRFCTSCRAKLELGLNVAAKKSNLSRKLFCDKCLVDRIETARGVIREVAKRCSVPETVLQSDKKGKRVTYARDRAVWEVREATSLPWVVIGSLFNRSHATMLEAYKREKLRVAIADGNLT